MIQDFKVVEKFHNDMFNITCGIYYVTVNDYKYRVLQCGDNFEVLSFRFDGRIVLESVRESFIDELKKFIDKSDYVDGGVHFG